MIKSRTYDNIWTSLTVLTNELIDTMKDEFPTQAFEYIDWENANVDELPNTDLLGPTAVTISDYGQEQIEVTFAIGCSAYMNDMNLFRHRAIVGTVFERLRTEMKVDYYNTILVAQTSKLIITTGTLLSPMTKMNVRPWQYVQASALLVPE